MLLDGWQAVLISPTLGEDTVWEEEQEDGEESVYGMAVPQAALCLRYKRPASGSLDARHQAHIASYSKA